MHDALWAIVKELRELLKDFREFVGLLRELLKFLRHTMLKHNEVTGGTMFRVGDPMNPIQAGNIVKFQVTPTFSGDAFVLDGAKAAIASSDAVNFPVALDPTDAEGRTFVADLTAVTIKVPEDVTVTWTYVNADGIVATVAGTVTELGIVDDVNGGTFAQIA